MAEVSFNDQPKLQERESVQEPTLLQRTRQKLHNGAALLITAPVWFPVRKNEPQPDATQSQPSNAFEKRGQTARVVPHSAGPIIDEAKRALTEQHHPLRNFAKLAVKTLIGAKTGHYNP